MAIVFTAPALPVGIPTGWVEFTKSAGGFGQLGFEGANTLMPFNGEVYTHRAAGDTTFKFNPTSRVYTGITPTIDSTFPGYGSYTTLDNGKVLIRGHRTYGKLYDPDAGTLIDTTGTADVSRTRMAATLSGDAITFGGWYQGNSVPPGVNYRYDTDTNTWSTLGTTPPARLAYQDVAALADGRILIGGGTKYIAGGPGSFQNNYDYWFYDPSNDTYTITTPIPTLSWRKQRAGFVQLNTGVVYGLGGEDGGSTNLGVYFDVDTETWGLALNGPLTNFSFPTFGLSIMPDGTLVAHGSTHAYYATY